MNFLQTKSDNFFVTVKNNAWFVAEFFIDYQIGTKTYQVDSDLFPIGTSRTLKFPKNADIAYLTIDMMWFGAHHLYDQVYIRPGNHCFILSGSVFRFYVEEVPCKVLGRYKCYRGGCRRQY